MSVSILSQAFSKDRSSSFSFICPSQTSITCFGSTPWSHGIWFTFNSATSDPLSYLELGSWILASINGEQDILSAYVAGGILVPPEFIGALTKIEIMGAKHKRLWPKLATMWSSYGCDELFLKKKKKESLQNVSPPWDMINSFRPGNFPQFFISHRVQRTRQRINRSS